MQASVDERRSHTAGARRMSIRNLDRLLRPASVALVGASDRPGSLGQAVLRNLKAAGFAGAL